MPANPDLEAALSRLDRLARKLAINYVDTSLRSPDLTKKKRIATVERVCSSSMAEAVEDSPRRTLLLLGDGASRAAFGEATFPTGREAIERLDRDLPERPAWIEEQIREEKRRLSVTYKDVEEDFVLHLTILASFYPPDMVLDKLAAIYNKRYWPHLTFELVAHLLKHRFVDVVVNLSFDELLNQAVEEELGESEMHFVESDDDCRDLSFFMVADRLKKPIHVKPHTTVGNRGSTFRATQNLNFNLTGPIGRFLEKLIGGMISEDGGKRYPTTIISVGFDRPSPEINHFLRSTAPHPVTVYHFSTGESFERNRPRLVERTNIEHVLIDLTQFGTLHNTLRTLVNRIQENFVDPFKPRGIARHEIIHTLFFDEKRRSRVPAGDNGFEAEADYHRARLCAELMIGLAKNNGRIDLNSLVRDRVGTYFEELRSATSQIEGGDDDPEGASLNSIRRLFEGAGVTLPLGGVEGNILSLVFPNNVVTKREFWLWEMMCATLLRIPNPEIKKHVGHLVSRERDQTTEFDCFKSLYATEAREINPSFEHRQLLLSRAPGPDEVLHTHLALLLKMEEIARAEWEVLLVVSENGNTFRRCDSFLYPEHRATRSALLILAENEHSPATPAQFGSWPEDRLEVVSLPWWLHNRHMILGLKSTPDPNVWDYTSAIRYDRRGLSQRINPVYIHERNRADLDRLLETFFGYAWRAKNPDWMRTPEEKVETEVSKLRKNLLRKWRASAWEANRDAAD